jgi:glycine/D-amino acid oxidase-like deaminating enzyme
MMPMPSPMTVAVLGAGLTGVGTALELAKHGVRVVLIDQDERPMNRASLRNEGKIHLGLIYANAGTIDTAQRQLLGALRFRPLLARWIGSRADQLEHSTPFWYMVANDSLLSVEQLAEHYSAVESLYTTFVREDGSLDYLGTRPARLWEHCSRGDFERCFNGERFAGGFKTAELAIDTSQLAHLLRQAVDESPYIEFWPKRRVHGVDPRNGLWRVEGHSADGSWQLDVDQVVNALWENRLAIDKTAGLTVEPGWLYRLKYRVIASLPRRLHGGPSATMVLGRYGDVVIRSDGTAYLSWYPSGLRGWTHDLLPPDSWNGPCRGDVGPNDFQVIAGDTIREIDTWYPGIAASIPLVVDAGAIVAYGKTDVDDLSSTLHDRSRIGVVSVDGYHTVEPGKLTTAPLVAEEAARCIVGAVMRV